MIDVQLELNREGDKFISSGFQMSFPQPFSSLRRGINSDGPAMNESLRPADYRYEAEAR